MPSQSEWDAKSNSLKALWLINSERVARQLLPLQDVDLNVITVAQGHANYLMTNNLFDHTGSGGTSPWQRLDAHPAINGHHDFLGVAENLFAFYSWPGPNPMTIERSVHGWNYADASSSWGHRHALLWTAFTNNYGDVGSEGLMGVGSATGAYGSGCGCNGGGMWPAGDVVVFNVFDPDATYNAALPVQLSSFTGSVIGQNQIRLKWTTASEVNNYGFYVERRRANESQFAEVPNSFIAGHGTTNQPYDYAFTDGGVSSGAWHYRLRQVDLDGFVHYSDEILINTLTGVGEQTPVEFSLGQNYPNPFNPTTSIALSLPVEANVSLEVFDLLGSRVVELASGHMEAGYHKVVFDASRLSSGIYYYRLKAGSFVASKKLALVR